MFIKKHLYLNARLFEHVFEEQLSKTSLSICFCSHTEVI